MDHGRAGIRTSDRSRPRGCSRASSTVPTADLSGPAEISPAADQFQHRGLAIFASTGGVELANLTVPERVERLLMVLTTSPGANLRDITGSITVRQ